MDAGGSMKRRTSWLRQAALVVAGGALVLGVAIGFWPVSVSVAGGASYSCGSGFVHSRQTWKFDAGSLAQSPDTVGASTATPNAACPSQVYRHRDFAYALLALAAATYLALIASSAFDPAVTPTATRRRKSRRVTA
jgi:hypothetical protein